MAANIFKLRRRNGPTDLSRLDLQYRTRRKFYKVSSRRASSRTLARGAVRSRKIADDQVSGRIGYTCIAEQEKASNSYKTLKKPRDFEVASYLGVESRHGRALQMQAWQVKRQRGFKVKKDTRFAQSAKVHQCKQLFNQKSRCALHLDIPGAKALLTEQQEANRIMISRMANDVEQKGIRDTARKQAKPAVTQGKLARATVSAQMSRQFKRGITSHVSPTHDSICRGGSERVCQTPFDAHSTQDQKVDSTHARAKRDAQKTAEQGFHESSEKGQMSEVNHKTTLQSGVSIPLIVKAKDAADSVCQVISVASTWSQKELCKHLQSLYGDQLVFTLGGKQLKELQGRLCDGSLAPYSLVSYESIQLQGGSTRKISAQAASKSGAADSINQSVEVESARLLSKVQTENDEATGTAQLLVAADQSQTTYNLGQLEPVVDASAEEVNADNLDASIVKEAELHQKVFGFDNKQFKILDKKIKKRNQATKEEVDSFGKLVPQMARKQVERFNLTQEEEKKLFELHMGTSKELEIKIEEPQQFVYATTQTIDLKVEWVQAFAGDITKHEYYDAFMCRIPGIKPKSLQYKLFVKENHPDSDKKIVYEQSFGEMNAFTLARSTLLVLERDNNLVKIKEFKTVFQHPRCFTEETPTRFLKLPADLKVKMDTSQNIYNRQALATNLPEYFKKEGSPLDQETLAIVKEKAEEMTIIDQSSIQYGPVNKNHFYLNTETGVKDIKYSIKRGSDELTVQEAKDVRETYAGFTNLGLFTVGEYFLILMQNLEEKKIWVERWFTKSKRRVDELLDFPYPILKAFNREWKIFTLDTNGTFRIIDLFRPIASVTLTEHQCVDIFITSSSFFTQRIVKDKLGVWQPQILRRDHQFEEDAFEEEDFQLIKAISQESYVPSFFEQCYSTRGFMLLMIGQSIYVRNEITQKWKDSLVFKSQIVSLYPLGVNKDQQEELLCITEFSLESLTLSSNGAIQRKTSQALPGRPIRTQQSIFQWGLADVLILIQRRGELSLWTCSADLKMVMLLKDSSEKYLDHRSFFNLIDVTQSAPESEKSQEALTLALVCCAGGQKKQFNIYELPPASHELQVNHSQPSGEQLINCEEAQPIAAFQSLNFLFGDILSLFQVKTEYGNGLVLIAKGEKLKSSVIILDDDLERRRMPELDGLRIEQVTERMFEKHLFALDANKTLIAMDFRLLCKGVPIAPYKMLNFAQYGDRKTFMSVDRQNIWLFHASGTVQRIQGHNGTMQLEDMAGTDNYLAWKQQNHLLAAVDRFNVVTFWNTLTGKLIYKKLLQGSAQIADAFKFRRHDTQMRYQDASNQFDTFHQTLVSYSEETKGDNDEEDCYLLKLINFNVFGANQRPFEASCQTIVTCKVYQGAIREDEDRTDKWYTFFYNRGLDTLFAAQANGDIEILRKQVDHPEAEWKLDSISSEEADKAIGLARRGKYLLENHISPDGKYILTCNNGLKVQEFKREDDLENDKVVLEEKQWTFPIKTEEMDPIELAKRVKFESPNVVRILTTSERDILYELVPNQKEAKYLSEVKVEKLFYLKNHKIASHLPNGVFQDLVQNARQFRASYWHKQNLENSEHLARMSKFSMITPAQRTKRHFVTRLSFRVLDWFLGLQIATGVTNFEKFNDRRKLELTLSIYPQQETLMHLIAHKSNQDDQSQPAAQLRSIQEAAIAFDDPVVLGTDEPQQFLVPLVTNKQGMTAIHLMDKYGLRSLSDIMMQYTSFQYLINYQSDVNRIMQQEAPNLIKCIESSLMESETTCLIESLDMPANTQIITFRSELATLNQEEIQHLALESLPQKELISLPEFLREDKLVNTNVIVRVIDIRWLLRESKNFLDFVPILEACKLDKLYQTDFMKSLTHEFWTKYQQKILYRALLPWLCFSILSIFYFARVLNQEFQQVDGGEKTAWKVYGGILTAFTIYELQNEVKQFLKDTKGYFFSPYNWIDLFQYLGTLWIVVLNVFEFSAPVHIEQRNVCAFVILCQGVKAVLDWLRLFDNTSFYVTLITKTISDIGYIGFIISIILIYVGVATYMLQLNADPGEDSAIVQSIFGNFLVDSIIGQYLLMLGEFHMDGFKNHVNASLCYVFFISTTIISQITFLNMLIAIMGDTFDRVIDQRPTYSLKNKLMLMAAMKSMIRSRRSDETEKVFIYVIQPANKNEDQMNEDEAGWRGKLWYIQSFIRSKFEKSNDLITGNLGDLRTNMDKNIAQIKDSQSSMQKKLEAKIDSLVQTVKDGAPAASSRPKEILEAKRLETQARLDTQGKDTFNIELDLLSSKMDSMLKNVNEKINKNFSKQNIAHSEEKSTNQAQQQQMRDKIDAMQAEMNAKIEAHQAEMKEKLEAQQTEMRENFSSLKDDIKAILAATVKDGQLPTEPTANQ